MSHQYTRENDRGVNTVQNKEMDFTNRVEDKISNFVYLNRNLLFSLDTPEEELDKYTQLDYVRRNCAS